MRRRGNCSEEGIVYSREGGDCSEKEGGIVALSLVLMVGL